MSSFDLAINTLLKIEGDGVVTNDPSDPGGLTKWGISKRYNPELDIENLSRDDAINFYRNTWWIDAYNQIENQDIANKVFFTSVHEGFENSHRCIQYAVRAASGVILVIDGFLGSSSVAAINACITTALLSSLKSEIAGLYRVKACQAPVKLKYITGWLNRAYA